VPSTQTKAEATHATVLPRTGAVEWARKLYDEAVDRKDAAGFAAVFTDDAWMRFGNAEPIVGRPAIQNAIAQFFTLIAGLRHNMTGIWSQQDAVICEATVTYTRHDRSTVQVPAVTIFRLKNSPTGPVAYRVQMFVDLAPLFGGS
jgi:ketosteroid isomerase-like protein